MDAATMGRVTVHAKIENLRDAYLVETQVLPPENARFLEVDDALVDTGATGLSMPKKMIALLGLKPGRTRKARTSAGTAVGQVYGGVRLTIQDRECLMDVSELPDDCPVLIGQIPLELLDFVVDVPGQKLIGNPAHGGEHMIEMY